MACTLAISKWSDSSHVQIQPILLRRDNVNNQIETETFIEYQEGF